MSGLTDDDLSILQADQATLRTLPPRIRRRVTKLDQYIGKDARVVIAGATSATPYTIHPVMNQSLRANQIRCHQILETHSALSEAEILKLKSLILNPDSHLGIRHADYWRRPEVAIRFHADTDLPVLIDFVTRGWCLSKEGGAWGPDSRFEPVAQQVVDLLSPYRLREHHNVSPAAPE